MRRAFCVVAITVAVGVLGSVSAGAIIGGSLTGSSYSNVGLLLDNGFPQCSGTLVSPTVFLTAAHCVQYDPTQSVTEVTFQSSVAFGSDGREIGAVTIP